MPMTCKSLGNDKIQWEMGLGRVPEEASQKMELLLKDYIEGVRMLTQFEFNELF